MRLKIKKKKKKREDKASLSARMKQEAWTTNQLCSHMVPHAPSYQLTMGLIFLNNSRYASEKASCPEEEVN